MDEKGHEYILKLSIERWWLIDFEGDYQLIPSRFNSIFTYTKVRGNAFYGSPRL